MKEIKPRDIIVVTRTPKRSEYPVKVLAKDRQVFRQSLVKLAEDNRYRQTRSVTRASALKTK